MTTGRCMCGAVTFRFTGEVLGNSACHCGQCRKWSGHVWASANVPDAALEVTGEVTWFASSDFATRGFCPVCGSALFWKRRESDRTAVAMGALDTPTGLRLEKHIFTEDKGDYYDIADGLPQS